MPLKDKDPKIITLLIPFGDWFSPALFPFGDQFRTPSFLEKIYIYIFFLQDRNSTII